LTTDERGAKIPGYLTLLAAELKTEHTEAMRELTSVAVGIEHIAEIVAAQQDNARVAGLVEDVSPAELLEYACRMSEASLLRHGVSVTREFMATPPVRVQRQKALQVLVNLVRNADDSLGESNRPDKRLILAVQASADGIVRLSVSDNGIGIPKETIGRIFEFGFTTKQKGHGFGLHSSALAAREMGGSLQINSDGAGHGATCILTLPIAPPDRASSPGPAT
jgi:C4-dicarboxylate-specific signal transduction histidine kinase